MTLQTLENVSVEWLLEVFNLSFSDYIIPFCLTGEQLVDKLKSDSIELALSVGAFENNQLVAFILHGCDVIDNKRIAYNAGTGVIPAKRGNGLTTQLYKYILPILRENSITKVVLEVITSNEIALKVYESLGFIIVRSLSCFTGLVDATPTANAFEIHELGEYNWQELRSFWDVKPTWQNSITVVEKIGQTNLSVGLYEHNKLLGYTIYNPKTKRIQQLAVDKNYRRNGIGLQLLKYISKSHQESVAINNIDDSSENTVRFLTDVGLRVFIKQYEMELTLC